MQDFQQRESDSGYDRCLPRDTASIDARTQLGLTEIFPLLAYFLIPVSISVCAAVAQLQTNRNM